MISSANQHEITADYLFSARIGKVLPFPFAGGILATSPAGAITGETTNTSSEFVYVFGLGLDWKLLPNLGMRFQFRDGVFKAPNITSGEANNNYILSQQPMIGAYYKF